MQKETFDNVPDCIHWQGEDLQLLDIYTFTGHEETHTWKKQIKNNLEGMTRFAFGTRRANGDIAIKLMRYSWHGGRDIDWELLNTCNAKGE